MPKNRFARALNPTGDVWAGRRLGNRAAAHGIYMRGDDGVEVLAAEAYFRGKTVAEDPDDANIAIIEDASGVRSMLNNSGADVPIYALVVTDPTEDDAFTTTTTPQVSDRGVGVTQAAIAAGESGPVMFSGITPVGVGGAVTRGDFLETSAVAGEAETNASRREGTFGVLLEGADPADGGPTGAADLLIDSQVTEKDTASTSLTIDMPATVPDGMQLILALWLDPASSAPAISGWTRIGSTAGFRYYRRIAASEPASYAVTWTGPSRAVAAVLVFDGLDTASVVVDFAYEATGAAAALSGLASATYLILAAVQAIAADVADWATLARGSTSGVAATDYNLAGTVTSAATGGGSAFANPGNANDGSDATAAIAPSATTPMSRWLQTDLGAAHAIGRMELVEASDTGFIYYPAWSTDAVTWHQLGSPATGPTATRTYLGSNRSRYDFSEVTARYWRLVDGPFTSGGAKVALTWQTWTVEPIPEVAGTIAARYVDGTAATSPFSGTGLEPDAIFALALTVTPFITGSLPLALIDGALPDLIDPADVSSPLIVQDEGSPLATAADVLNFVGAGVVASGAGSTKTITIPGGGAGSGTPGWFNVKDPAYGAVGDGTTDDTAAINLAIAALNAAGRGVLYFPAAASYKVTAGLTTITVPCLILGDGHGDPTGANISEIAFTSTTGTLFTVSASGCVFRGLAMDQTGGTATAGGAIVTTGGVLAEFDGISIRLFYVGIDIENSNIWTIQDCYITGVHYALRVRNTSIPDTGDWSIVNTNFAPGAGTAVRIESAGGGRLTNVKINGNGAGSGHGIDLALVTGAVTGVLLITNTSIENVGGNGINLTTVGTGTYGGITIVGCEFGLYSNTSGHAIAIAGSGSGSIYDVALDDLICRASGGNSGAAITLSNVDNLRIGAIIVHGFGSTFSQSSSTNVVDDTGAIAAGVHITGTPSSGDVPIASSGTAAAWGPVAGGLTGFATPAIVLGTAAAAGAATTAIRSDSTIVAFDGTAPVTQALGDSAAAGSAAVSARRDHKHGMPALSTATPLVDSGTGAVGTGTASSREDHVHPASTGGGDPLLVMNVTYSGDASRTAFELPAAPFDAYSVAAYVAGTRTAVTLSGTLLTTMTFGSAPASGTDNVVVDILAAAA